MALRFAEELLILVEEASVPNRTVRYALAGAVLMDLALERRIDTDLDALFVIDATPLEDDLLDPVLTEIAGESESRSCEFWVRRIADRGDCLRGQALARLEAKGIMESDDGGLFSVALRVRHTRRYPTESAEAAEQEIRSRIMEVLANEEVIPSPRDAAIISLCRACGLIRQMLNVDEYQEAEKRIDLIAGLELSARSLIEAIQTLTVAEAMAEQRIVQEKGGGWPMGSGRLPVLGHAFRLSGDPLPYLTEQYLKHGPVFELRAPRRRYVAMAGTEANLFLGREGKFHLRNRDVWTSWNQEMGASNTIITLDGAEHRLLRSTIRTPYSRNFILRKLPDIVDMVDQELAELPNDRPVVAFDMLRRIITEQVTILTTGTSCRDHVEDLATFQKYTLMVHILKRYPKLALKLPPMRRGKQTLEALTNRTLRDHEGQSKPENERDIVDRVLELHRSHPEFMSTADVFANACGPFLLGLDSAAAAASFAFYALLRNPDVADRVRQEADDMFAAGGPTPEFYQKMTATKWLLMESMRMYPVASMLPPREVVNPFEFAGYIIPHGTRILPVPAVHHFLPEYFRDPYRFDIDRYAPDRREHAQRGVYFPYGVGQHTCLGQGFADVQIVMSLATLLHRADFVMDSTSYRLRRTFIPAARPDGKFRVRLTPRR